MSKKLIIFGPWCGEFCYELSWWIPEIRKLRYENFKDYDAFVFGYNGRKITMGFSKDGYQLSHQNGLNGMVFKDSLPQTVNKFQLVTFMYYEGTWRSLI